MAKYLEKRLKEDISTGAVINDALESATTTYSSEKIATLTGGHTQNTDTGTTGNTFTVDSDSTIGKIIVDVATGAADLSLTLTNEALTVDNKIATLQNKTGTLALTSDIPVISDTAYDATTWDANTDGASKNAIRDQVESMLSTLETKTVVAGKKVYHGVASYADLAFSNANKALTLSAITYWYKGVQYTTASTVTCDLDLTADRDNSANTLTANTLYYFYFKDATGKLYWSDSAWDFKENVFVASVFWNGSAGACQNETHNHTRDLDWHIWAHDTIGTRYESGSELTAPTTANDAALQIETGTYHDEDIDFVTGQCTTMRAWYKASASVFTFADYSLPYVGTSGQPKWLDTDDYTLKDVGASDFVRMWVYASADIARPIYIMPTHRATAYNTIGDARADTAPATIGTNVNAEYKLIYSFIYKGDGEFQEAVDYRTSSPVPSGGVPSIAASGVSFAPTGNIVAVNVQTAIEELDTEKISASYGGIIPIGGIIMWYGTIATIPANWYLCNGSNSTPDLRDKFIVGATSDDAGVAKTNIAGALSQTGGATGHSHSGHAALSHSGFSITDHTGLTHGLTIANHPDLTHVALASHPALTIEGQTHANVTLPGYTHPVLTIEGMTHPVQSIASRNDVVVAGMTHADFSSPSRSIVNAAIAGKASFASGTNRSGMTSVPTNSGTMAATTHTFASHPTQSATIPAWSISPASHPTFTASAPASHPTQTVAVASHPTFTASGLTHGGVGSHIGTDYGVHSITAPAGHGTAGTVTHSFSESSAHSLSAHDTVSQLPSYYALAFIMRYQ